jgi:hypothetical protein
MMVQVLRDIQGSILALNDFPTLANVTVRMCVHDLCVFLIRPGVTVSVYMQNMRTTAL